MTDLNYTEYLQSVYPGTTWETTRLTGGVVNSTHRATRLSGSAGPASLVLKHARSYVESVGPGLHFSTQRQAVEAAILKLWDEDGPLFESRKTVAPWKTPRLLRHDSGKESVLKLSVSDQEASILLLSDLGRLVNVVEFIKTAAKDAVATADKIAKLGRDTGSIMALVHSPETVRKIQAEQPQTYEKLSVSVSKGIVWEFAVLPIKERIKSYANADKLFTATAQEYNDPEYDYRPALSIGDFHPGSILLSDPAVAVDLTPALVDWEFGRANGRGVNGDVAQFLSSMRCEILDAQDDAALHALLVLYVTSFCSAYREAARLRVRRDVRDGNLQLLRSAFSLHGREDVNLAHDVYHASARRRDMIDVGVWYLERAGDSAEHFVSDANWEEIKKEDRCLLQSLFIME
ncbi:hypothetical protein ISF_08028 [Cordyceps fumosorosea ARSEF 2679]|uniref:Protein kinase-like domain protein n=1 Tax=Cordyceps fumosorosea (strain ARSEF 2679) TaxID=1081104 RepID=A0A167N426_CORFA|nr:hypothetical protein ISF_08028 [Cordyceps fumosorosea ARSEF 2679]OAA55107.1 hypothetical protein ISF_08028 [Cordyceps fumosorosea ARSEF 2679]